MGLMWEKESKRRVYIYVCVHIYIHTNMYVYIYTYEIFKSILKNRIYHTIKIRETERQIYVLYCGITSNHKLF